MVEIELEAKNEATSHNKLAIWFIPVLGCFVDVLDSFLRLV